MEQARTTSKEQQNASLADGLRRTGSIAWYLQGAVFGLLGLAMLFRYADYLANRTDTLGESFKTRVVTFWVMMLIAGLALAAAGIATALAGRAFRTPGASAATRMAGLGYAIFVAIFALAFIVDAAEGATSNGIMGAGITFLLAGAAGIAAFVVSAKAGRDMGITTGVLIGVAGLLLLVGNGINGSAATGLVGTDSSQVVLAGLALIVAGVALAVHHTLAPRLGGVGPIIACGAAALFAIGDLVGFFSAMGQHPFTTTNQEFMAATGTVFAGIAAILSLLAALAIIGAVVLALITYIRPMIPANPYAQGWTDAAPAPWTTTPPAPVAPVKVPAGKALCPRCQAPNPKGARFCNNCGYAPGGVA
ncbi:MAG: zinc ribbon domain-containing protein [bacterium]